MIGGSGANGVIRVVLTVLSKRRGERYGLTVDENGQQWAGNDVDTHGIARRRS